MKTADSVTSLSASLRASCNRKSGSILAMVMIIMVMLGMIGTGLISLGTRNGVETVRMGQREQAFWLAEAGLHEGTRQLVTSSYFRNSISQGGSKTLSGSCGSGSFVGVIRRPASSSSIFEIESSATAVGQTRGVAETLVIQSALDYAVIAEDAITLRQSSSVANGPISCPPAGRSVLPGGNTTNYWFGDQVPTPVLNTVMYDSMISDAAQNTATNTFAAGTTNYFTGDITLGSITNSHVVIVSTGNITLENGAMITNNCWLIAGGGLYFRQGFGVGSFAVLYAITEIRLGQQGQAQENRIGDQCAVLTPGSIIANQSLNFNGIMYAGGGIDLKEGGTLVGAVISGDEINANRAVTVTWDHDAFPPNMDDLGLDHHRYLARRNWRELP